MRFMSIIEIDARFCILTLFDLAYLKEIKLRRTFYFTKRDQCLKLLSNEVKIENRE